MGALGHNALSTVFLDRDGTLNVKAAPDGYVTSPDDLILLPGAGPAVARLNAAGLRTILISNQRWLSRPSADLATYGAVQRRLEQLLAAHGAWLDASYYCPHAIGACDCRKPGAGLLRQAAGEHGFNHRDSVVVGDSETDMMAGQSVGAATILLRPTSASELCPLADAVATDLMAAVRLIVRERTS